MPNKVNNFKSFNEARLRDNKGLNQDYINRIKREEEAEAQRKIQSSEVGHPSEIMGMVSQLMEIQGGRLQQTPMGPIPVWIDMEKKAKIEQLARDIIDAEYGEVIEANDIKMDIKLVDPEELQDMKGGDEIQDEPEEMKPNIEQEETDDEDFRMDVDKRKMANIVSQGSAKNTHRLIHLHRDKIDEIDPRLFEIMDRLIKTMETAEWTVPEREGNGKMIRQFMNGYTKVEREEKEEKEEEEEKPYEEPTEDQEEETPYEEEPEEDYNPNTIKVIARAIDLTVLLHEAVKGIYDVFGRITLPEDEESAQNIKINTDTLEDEFEDLRYGPRIRQDLLNFVNTNSKVNEIPNSFEYVWGAMLQMKSINFLSLIKDILIEKTGKAERWLEGTLTNLVNLFEEYGRQKMEYDLGQKNEPEEDSNVIDEPVREEPRQEEPRQEEPRQEEPNYAIMTPHRLKVHMDAALDAGDFDLAKKIGVHIK